MCFEETNLSFVLREVEYTVWFLNRSYSEVKVRKRRGWTGWRAWREEWMQVFHSSRENLGNFGCVECRHMVLSGKSTHWDVFGPHKVAKIFSNFTCPLSIRLWSETLAGPTGVSSRLWSFYWIALAKLLGISSASSSPRRMFYFRAIKSLNY